MLRDNGFEARSWAFLIDVAPPIAAEILDLLGTARIAARSTPYEPQHPARYSTIGPAHELNRGPLVRVDVDADARADAAQLMQKYLPAVVAPLEQAAAESANVDAQFRSIVAGIGPVEAPQAADGRTAGYADPLAPGYDVGENEAFPNVLGDDDTFTPPPPPPLPRGTKNQRWAWAGLFFAPLYLIVQGVTGFDFWGLSAFLNIAAVVVAIASFIYLLSTLREEREDDDDGAVV